MKDILPQQSKEKLEILNTPISIKEIEFRIKTFPIKKTLGPVIFCTEFQ